ncbi:MAG TPA: cation diffusion facilitator family transporter [Gaiellaceae bacterium]|nr:cation diffusion facilitator family transporter [Gaiellaceae bacterium]
MHAHEHAHGLSRSAGTRALAVALGLIVAFAVVEVVAGLAADSLALLADAGHMVGDAASLALALVAAWAAGRPATPQRSFGFRRAEILAALVNGVGLVVIATWIFVEAIDRLSDPPEPLGGWMLAVGVAGLAVNVAAARVMHGAGSDSLNVRAALRHVLADVLGSVGVIVAGVVVLATGWAYADPLVSLAIGLLVLASSWSVLRDSVGILLEATPRGLDADAVGSAMAGVEGVREVHDLHIWTITSGFPALSAHVLVAPVADCHAIRAQLEELLRERFDLAHTTLQVEHAAPVTVELSRHFRG